MEYKALNDSVLKDSATSSSNVRVLPPWASSLVSSDAGLHGSTQRSHPCKRESALNGKSSSSKNVRNPNRYNDRHGKHTKVSSNNGTGFDNQLVPKGAKRVLPPTFQVSSSNSKPSLRVKDVGSSQMTQIHENYEKPYPPAVSSHTNLHMQDNFSRPNYDVATKNHHGSRVLPSWKKGPTSAPATQYAGQSDPYHPATAQETVGDERHIYETALRGLHQPIHEATLPDGLLSACLFRHQKIALAWMLQTENSVVCSGGILADDQGLGKTISIIALILMQKSSSRPKTEDPCASQAEALDLDDDNDKDTLVMDEDKKAGESDEVKLITKVNSSSSTRGFRNRKPSGGSLVVCPASVLRQWARELDEKVADEAKLDVLIYHGGNRTKDPAELAKYDVVLTTYSIVAKEVPTKSSDDDDDDKKDGDVHRLSSESANKKRKKSRVSKKGKKGRKGSSAVDYSGTLAKVHWFRVILDEAQTIKNSSTQVSRSCCGLRAKKRWCLSGTPIQNSIDELFSYFKFLKCEPYADYKSFCNQIKIPISRNSSQGYKKLQAVLRTIMLRRTKDTLIDGKAIINLPPKTINLTTVDFSAEERTFYRELEAESLKRFKAYAAAGTVRQNYANILLMLLRLRQACDHPLLVKGFSSESVSPVSTKTAQNLSKDKQASLLNLLETLNICFLCSDPPEDAVITICGHIFCYQCVAEYLTGDDNTCPSPNCKSQIGHDVVFSKATLKSSISDDDQYECLPKTDEKSPVFQDNYTSSKIRVTLDIIQSHCRAEISNLQGEGAIKTIVFSQWTRMLDLVEWSLNEHCIESRRLDGSMSLVSRDRAVKDFNTDPEVIVMLVSLKAGNLGLNMVAASHVILLDLWWNPATEDQAIDRAHRIGQTRPVTVSRLTIKDTVEDRIIALQEEKRKMVASAFGEGQSGSSVTSLTAQDLKYLFMGAH